MELLAIDISWVTILFYLLLVDSIGAIFVAFLGSRWYVSYLGVASEWFPPAKGWALLYFGLALLLVLTHHGYVG